MTDENKEESLTLDGRVDTLEKQLKATNELLDATMRGLEELSDWVFHRTSDDD